MNNPPTGAALTIETDGQNEFGPCPCCGDMTRRVWGYAHRSDGVEAAYFVEWVPGAARRHGAMFDLILGRWGPGTAAADRVAVAVQLRHMNQSPEFMVVDAAGRSVAASPLVGEALSRDKMLGSEFAARAFAVVDAVWLQDERIGELVAPVA